MEQVDCVVVGAGVVGLAVARALALQGREVVVLEAATAIGTGISARSSEVIHAGLYYPQGSLKARLCVQGRRLLIDYCQARGVEHRLCGKLVVATSSAQLATLQAIADTARANGARDLQWLSADDARALEPELACVGALLSPGTGIVDSHGLMLALQGDTEHFGGNIVLNTQVVGVNASYGAINFELVDGARLQTRSLVNAAGLGAIALAQATQGLAPQLVPVQHYAKGSYFSLPGRAPFRHLIYPVPEPGGLGVHLTLDLGGQARFGPDVQWTDRPDALLVDAHKAPDFEAAVRPYWPGIPAGALQPAYAGMRPKIHGPAAAAADFVVQGPAQHGIDGLVNLFGIESPGLTSALALGDEVAALLA